MREPGRAQGAIFHSDRLTARHSSTEFRTPPKALRIKQSMRRVDSALDKRRRRVALRQLQIGDRHPGPGHPRRGPAGPRSPTSATTTTTVHTRLLKHAPRTKPVSAVHPSPRSMKARSRGGTSLLRTRGLNPRQLLVKRHASRLVIFCQNPLYWVTSFGSFMACRRPPFTCGNFIQTLPDAFITCRVFASFSRGKRGGSTPLPHATGSTSSCPPNHARVMGGVARKG